MQTPIVPVAVFPSIANTLSIRGVGPVDDSGRPNYLWQLQDVQLVSPAIPAVPATEDTPEVPSVEAVYSTTTLTSGNEAMSVAQWNNWGRSAVDEPYQINCIVANLGLSLPVTPVV